MIRLEPLANEEALAFWQDKVKLSPGEFRRLAAEARVRAFAVAGMAKGAELDSMFNALQRAIDKGVSFEQFKDEIADIAERRGWVGPRARRLDTIFRTNIQTAYSVGHYRQMLDVVATRPYWQYSAVNDSRTRPTHAAMNGKVFRWDHPFWDKWYPPNGFRCRCGVVSLSEDDVRRENLTVEQTDPSGRLIEPVDPLTGQKLPARPLMPDPGFAHHPGKAVWALETELYQAAQTLHPQLRDMFAAAMATTPLRGEAFRTWAEEVVQNRAKRGEAYPVGWIHPQVLQALADRGIEAETAVIVINDKRVVHSVREAKGASALDAADFLRLPEILANPEAVLFDRRKQNLLYITSLLGEQKGKVVVEVNYTLKKKGTVNFVLTAGREDLVNLKREQYEVLLGEVK